MKSEQPICLSQEAIEVIDSLLLHVSHSTGRADRALDRALASIQASEDRIEMMEREARKGHAHRDSRRGSYEV